MKKDLKKASNSYYNIYVIKKKKKNNIGWQ